jgi:large subunit ribosomal protein L37Ae
MAKKVEIGPAKRYATRYGRRNREKTGILEQQYRKPQKCPYCKYVKVKRLSSGIWQCDKCKAKFAGRAYTFEPSKKTIREAVTEEEIKSVEEPEEEFEDYEEEPAEEKEEKEAE